MTKLFLGGVSSKTNEQTIRDVFSRFGEVNDAVVMRDRGFGFVTFATREGADNALREPHQVVDGQNIDVKPAQGKSGGSGSRGGSSGGNSSDHGSSIATDKVFVGGLPQDCSDDKIKRYFERYGTIVDAVVMKDRQTNRSRGFGFIQYDNAAPVEKVMADYSIHKIEGKWVEVKRSIPRDKMPPPESSGSSRSSSRGSSAPSGYPAGYGPPAAYPGGAYVAGPYGYKGGYTYPYGYGAYPGYPAYGGYGMPPPAAPGYGGYPPMDPYAGYGAYGAPPPGKGRSAPY